MNVSISTPGSFHAFEIASGLSKKGQLDKIYTTLPKFKTRNKNVPSDNIASITHPEALYQILSRFPLVKPRSIHEWKNYLFDRAVAQQLERSNCDLFIGFAGACRQSLSIAQTTSKTTGIERSSTHIRFQRDILREEYTTRGHDDVPISDSYLEREEHEYDLADYIIVPSEFVKKTFIDQGFSEDKIICEPFGVPLPDSNQRYDNDDQFRFLFLGQSSLRKGTPYLLEAWQSLDLDAELAIAGDVDDSVKPLMKAAEKNDSSINILGWVEDINEWFAKSDIFVFPSLEEGSAMVTYQAMASGIPLITTPNSGWVGVDGEHGIEIPSRESDEFASAMAEIYRSDEKRDLMGDASRSLIASNYTVADYQERIINRYKEMIQSPSGI